MNSVLKNRNNLEEEGGKCRQSRQKTYKILFRGRESNEKVYPKRPPSRSIHVINSTGTGSCQDMQGLTEVSKAKLGGQGSGHKPFRAMDSLENIIKADDPFQKVHRYTYTKKKKTNNNTKLSLHTASRGSQVLRKSIVDPTLKTQSKGLTNTWHVVLGSCI